MTVQYRLRNEKKEKTCKNMKTFSNLWNSNV